MGYSDKDSMFYFMDLIKSQVVLDLISIFI